MLRHLLALVVSMLNSLALASERPNVVWITVEDMSPWLSAYGDDTVPTPHIDRLAREGVVYERAYATTPVCAPARATLITGLYATSIGAMHMRTGNPSGAALARDPRAYDGIPSYEATPPPDVRCFPELLRRAGYYCTNRSKMDYQFRAPVTVWDESSGRAHWRGREAGQPFFAVFNFGVTHESGTFPERKPPPSVADPRLVAVPPYYPDTATVRSDIARTYDNIAAVDQRVGRVLRELEEDGLLESTYVFFFSDHGVGLPRGKRSVYASGTRVPLIVRAPGGEAGRTNRLVSFVDFAPTVLSLASVEVPKSLQGVAFLGERAGPAREYAFVNADRMDSCRDSVRAVTDGRYRYVRNFMPERPHLYPVAYAEQIPMMVDLHELRRSGRAGPSSWQIVSSSKPGEELYDTLTDPHEIENVVDAAAHSEALDRLRRALDGWLETTGDLGLMPEHEMVRSRLWPPSGEQPRTGAPEIGVIDGVVTLRCDTPGASIGWRIGEGSFAVYAGPFRPGPGELEVVTHRIGYLPSRTTVVID